MRKLALMLAVLLLAAACSNGNAAGDATTTTPPTTTEAPTTIAPTTVPATTTSTAAAPVEFDSAAYRYHAVVPSGLQGVPIPAETAWDGTSPINSTGPYTDRFRLPGGELVFVYGAPTELELADFAVSGQRAKNEWHGCPETPDRQSETTFGGAAAILYAFPCGGLYVFTIYTIHDGLGVAFNQLTPPGDPVADEAAFSELLAAWSWLD